MAITQAGPTRAASSSSPPPPPGPTGREGFRLATQLLRDPAPALDELARTFGPVSQLRAGPVRIVVVGSPDALRSLFTGGADSYRWRHRYNAVGVRIVVGSGSMIVSDGPDHARRRGAAQASFTRPAVDGLAKMIEARADAAVDELLAHVGPAGADVDLYPVVRRLVLGVILEAFFGEASPALVDTIGGLMQRPQDFLEAPALQQLPHPLPFTRRWRVNQDRRALDRLVDAEVARRRADPDPARRDILQTLLDAGTLTDDEIRDQASTLIGAGYDTTAAALSWLFLETARHPEVGARLRDRSDDLGYAGLVVKESLRLHPAGLVGVRVAATDLEIGGHLVRRGTLIAWSPYLAGRDPASWPDPLAFHPERFTDLTDEQRRLADRAWVPFGRGPHMCLGYALADLEMRIVLARFHRRLDVRAVADEIPPPVGMVVNRPIGGAMVRVRPLAVTPAASRG